MLIAYLTASLIQAMYISYIWSSNGFANTAVKTAFSIYAFWTAALLLGVLSPIIAASNLVLF